MSKIQEKTAEKERLRARLVKEVQEIDAKLPKVHRKDPRRAALLARKKYLGEQINIIRPKRKSGVKSPPYIVKYFYDRSTKEEWDDVMAYVRERMAEDSLEPGGH